MIERKAEAKREQKGEVNYEQKRESHPRVPRAGYGGTHQWLRYIQTRQDNQRGVTYTRYVCDMCSATFVHHHVNYMEFEASMRVSMIAEVCPAFNDI